MNINMKSTKNHEYVSIGSQNASHRIILLHGWGADADDLIEIGNLIINDAPFPFEIISLRAPNLHVNNIGRQWYSLFPANWSEAEIEVSKLICTLQELGNLDIPLKRTILFGFSQGAAMALDAGFKLDLGLIVSCSGYSHPIWKPGKDQNILISHGINDEIVPPIASQKIITLIKDLTNSRCELHEFEGAHEIDMNFVELIKSKIRDYF